MHKNQKSLGAKQNTQNLSIPWSIRYVTAITKHIKELGVLEEVECLIEFDTLATSTVFYENGVV